MIVEKLEGAGARIGGHRVQSGCYSQYIVIEKEWSDAAGQSYVLDCVRHIFCIQIVHDIHVGV
jgi:hypothetical protein